MWTAWQAIIGFNAVYRIGDISFFNMSLFQLLSMVQLVLAAFSAALFTTNAISHEKDRRTFILLLVTRLKDPEIIIEKFLAGFLQVASIMLIMLPVFMGSVLLGGVSFDQVFNVYCASFGTALLGGTIGIVIAAWREKTYQAVALTLLTLLLVAIGTEAAFQTLSGTQQSSLVNLLLAASSPIQAIKSAMLVDDSSWMSVGRLHLMLCLAVSMVLLTIATLNLRRWNPRGEPIQKKETEEEEKAAYEARLAGLPSHHAEKSLAGKDRFRKIWTNPVLWRETCTRAYGSKTFLIKAAYVVVVGVFLAWGLAAQRAQISTAGPVIAGTCAVLAIVSLLLLNAQAVTAITSERDLKSIDLLLVTDITPKEFIFGKLLGVLYNSKEMVLLPLGLILFWAIRGVVPALDAFYVSIAYLVWVAFSCVLGVHAGLRHNSTRASLANSLGTMFLLFVGIFICLFLIMISGRFDFQWGSFILFIVIGSIGLWISLGANAPSNAIGLAASLMPFATFYCIIAYFIGDRSAPFLVGTSVYSFAIAALLIPMISEFDVATGRSTAD